MDILSSIQIECNSTILNAELFNSPISEKLLALLPLTISLTKWGHELYGPIPLSHTSLKPVSYIPSGGIAYSSQGNYLCFFFGQQPAWPVDYIGKVLSDYSLFSSEKIYSLILKK